MGARAGERTPAGGDAADRSVAATPPEGRRARSRVLPFGVALLALVAIDLLIARFDVFGPLMPEMQPISFFAGINNSLTRAVRGLYPHPDRPQPVVLVGNSMFADSSGPLPKLARELERRGAPPGTPVVSLCVLATCPTDAEVLSRNLAAVRPLTVVLGIGAPDLGVPVERARATPVTQMLDTGLADGLVPPATPGKRADRWLRSIWRLYRYRGLLHDLLIPPEGPTAPVTLMESQHTPAEFFEVFYGPERGAELTELRTAFDRGGDPATFRRYLELLRGPDYFEGVRARWRGARVEELQVEALRRFVANVRAAGGRPAWVLLPENPLLLQDPELGEEVRANSDAVAARLAAEARALDVPLLDLRHTMPASAFVDLNHLYSNVGAFLPTLADALAGAGLVAPPRAEAARGT